MNDREESMSIEDQVAKLDQDLKKTRLLWLVSSIVMGVLLLIALGISVIQVVANSGEQVDAEQFSRLQADFKQSLIDNDSLQNRVNKLQLELDRSQAAAFRTLMFEQEESIQAHLQALKEGMRELANMIPRSRSWLDIYDEKMDKALVASKARMNKLSQIQLTEHAAEAAPEVPVRKIQIITND